MEPGPTPRIVSPRNRTAAPARVGGHYAVCDCCELEYPAREALPWHERKLARRLKILDARHEADDGPGPYREYWVDHEHRVCPACFADLEAGGRFRAIHRNKGKLAVLAVAATLVLLILTLPFTLPHLMSALYMWGNGRR